ncbi:quinone oxidoreductase family protein [Janthinobacterium agaricidamnosum]|uniref:Zinc-binding dehydrogenase family protein n=1 Tax=Janthinobacterium agaricidamnosum NBRC 102515 = DSM 9628 TaxID=1349767 RepID=W0V2Z3_9BURK|nr:quinone oxidoreductase [Janthinobacterium agaricidamnosum]CDG81642.1 zinc-binding dehydrogenase family protein [Janthinobacterium agaricidamnosum NBRC 102515 = DSM 9628]
MTKAIRINRTGGPEVMEYIDVDLPPPGPGEARIRHEAIGLNFIDVYFRTGLYPQPLPGGLGVEGAGIVEAIGDGVTEVKPGDRVAYAVRINGAYAQARNIPAAQLLVLPDRIGFDTAAAMMLQGLTVQYLFHRTVALKAGDTVLFHAAAGGVGLIACQWARVLGVNLIGTAGSDEKTALAKAHGASHVINYNTENFVERVRDITGGKGVSVVYDSIGKDTFTESLDCLAPLGTMVSFGNASGPVPPFSLTELASRGSLFITRPALFAYANNRKNLEEMSASLFGVVGSGEVQIEVRQRYHLADVARAHTELESRKTVGSSILLP